MNGKNESKDVSLPSACAAAPADVKEDINHYEGKPTPFHLRWIHGYNPKVGVINLNYKGSNTIFYAASNCGVLYNWTTKQMRILQGHKNNVTCITSDKSGKWIATSDSGPDNVVTIWDSQLCTPCRTIFNPHDQLNVSKTAMSGDAKHLVTLACGKKVEVCWWIWSLGWSQPHAKLEIDTPQEIQCVEFNPENNGQIVLMSKRNLWMVILLLIIIDERERTVDDKRHNTYELKVIETSLASDVASFTSFIFVPNRTQLFITTSSGSVLVYNYRSNENNVNKISLIKTLKIEKELINVIKFVDGVVVTGSKEGDIRFYDDQLRLLYWWSGNKMDCIKGLSFNLIPRSYEILNPKCKTYCECCDKAACDGNPKTPVNAEEEMPQPLLQHLLPSDATTFMKPFVVRDFIVQTGNQGIAFANMISEKLVNILDYRKSYITAMSVHPEKPLFTIGYQDGNIELVNYETHKIVANIDLRETYKVEIPPRDDTISSTYNVNIPLLSVTCLEYSPSGMHLACGLNTGQLLFLRPTTIHLIYQEPHHESSSTVTDICFSCDSSILALTHETRTISVYIYDCSKNCWSFISKYRTHCKDVTCTSFLKTKSQNDNYKLLTFGQDKVMTQYEVDKDVMTVTSIGKIEQTAVPLCGIEWPTVDSAENVLPVLLVANDEHKYNVINYVSGVTLATYLGPRYEDPVNRMLLVTKSSDNSYLLFATNKVIGVQKLPLDGNPYKHVGMLCNPKNIIFWSYKNEIETLFTLGKSDSCICQWEVNFNAVDITTRQGGGDLDPYYCLLEGGRFGWLYQEMRDLFYYIQVLCQGTFSPAIRRVGDFIPVESLPDIMRALGFFPTEYQIENMLTHAKYNISNKKPNTMISFEDFVKLYLNHRPAFGDNMTKIRNAFRNFANVRKDSMVISADDFIGILCDYGEKFTREQASYLLSILYGYSIDERSTMDTIAFSFLPKEISITEFIYNILGIQDIDIMSENDSVSCSMGSEEC